MKVALQILFFALAIFGGSQASAQSVKYLSCNNNTVSNLVVGDEIRLLMYCPIQSSTLSNALSSWGYVYGGGPDVDYQWSTVLSASASTGTLQVRDVRSRTDYTININKIAPLQPSLATSSDSGSSNADRITNDNTPTFTGVGQISRDARIRIGSGTGTNVGSTTASGTGAFSITTSTLSDGDYVAFVEIVDGGSTVSSATGVSFTIDTVAPVLSISNPISVDNLISAAESSALTISGVATGAEDGQIVTVTVSDGGASLSFTAAVSSGSWSTNADISALNDGNLTITANVTDVAGNAATQVTHLITKDATAPTISIAGALMGDNWVSAAEAANVTLSGIVGGVADGRNASINATGVGGTSLTGNPSVASSGWIVNLDFTGLSDGPVSIMADISDAAGNAATPASKTLTLDTTSPVVTDAGISISGGSGTGGAFKVGDTVTASWDTSGSDGDTNITASLGGATVDFSAFGGGSSVAASRSGSIWTATYTIVANTSVSGANLNVSVTATDEAGNTTTVTDTANVTVDAIPPVVTAANITLNGATGTGGAFKIGDTVKATWNSTSGGDNNDDIASASMDFTEFGGGAAVAATNTSGTWTATYTITSGTIDLTNRNVKVTAIDLADNQTNTTDDTNAIVDNIAPTVTPANISITGATGNPSNTVFKIGDTVTVTWDDSGTGDNNSDTISGATVDFGDFGGGASVVAANASGKWTATYVYSAGSVAGNTYRVAVTSTDNAGNATVVSDDATLSLDNVETISPAGTVLADSSNTGSTSDTITSNTKPTISGTSEPNATITIYVDGTKVGTATSDGSGTWSYSFQSDLGEGSNSITSTATDAVGNTSSPSAPLVLTLDTTPPSKPSSAILDDASNTGVTSDLISYNPTPTIKGVAEANSTVEIFVDGVSKGTTQADSSGSWDFALPSGSLTEGDNVITVTATDVADNTSLASNTLTIALDTAIPTIAITDPLMDDNRFNASETSAVIISGTTTDMEDGQTVSLTVTDGTTSVPLTTAVSGNAWTVTGDLSSLSDGNLTITADVTDVAGNAATQATHVIAKDIGFPTVDVSGPSGIITTAFDVTIVFSEPVTGFDIADVTVVDGTAIGLTGSGTTYTATIDPVLGTFVKVSVAANVAEDASGNPNTLSNVFEVQAGSPASEFDKYREEIKQVIVEEAERSLRSNLATNQRMVRSARDRFIRAQARIAKCEDQYGSDDCRLGYADDEAVPFDIDGTAQVSQGIVSTSGTFFEQMGNDAGTHRRLFFGDFDIQRDEDGSTTATLNARRAWEQMRSDKTMVGYYIGGSVGNSNIVGSFEGSNDTFAIDAGGYAVHQLGQALYLDGFASFGLGHNNLQIANDVLSLDSGYTTRTATIGASLSGVMAENGYELRPELAFSYGKTWIGDVGFTGRAYGLTDDTLSLDAGSVALGNLTLRTELIIPLNGSSVDESNAQFRFSPRVICEHVKTTTSSNYCGGGAEFGLTSKSDGGLSSADITLIMDRINGGTRSSVQFALEHKF